MHCTTTVNCRTPLHVRMTISMTSASPLRTLHRVAVHVAQAADLEVAKRYAREVAALRPVASLQQVAQQLRAVPARAHTHTHWRAVSDPPEPARRQRH